MNILHPSFSRFIYLLLFISEHVFSYKSCSPVCAVQLIPLLSFQDTQFGEFWSVLALVLLLWLSKHGLLIPGWMAARAQIFQSPVPEWCLQMGLPAVWDVLRSCLCPPAWCGRRGGTAGAAPQGWDWPQHSFAPHRGCWQRLWGAEGAWGGSHTAIPEEAQARGCCQGWLWPGAAHPCSSHCPWRRPARKGLCLARQEGRALSWHLQPPGTSAEQTHLEVWRLDQDRRQCSIPTTLFMFCKD